MKFISPAKINLGLSVLKKRSDDFHDIETVFQFLDWGDEIFISVEAKLKLLTFFLLEDLIYKSLVSLQ